MSGEPGPERVVGLGQATDRRSGGAPPRLDESTIQRFKAENPIVAQLLPAAVQHLFRLYSLSPANVYWAAGMVPYTEVDW